MVGKIWKFICRFTMKEENKEKTYTILELKKEAVNFAFLEIENRLK
ncbi:MAG: hypothetical protein U0T78_09415 [Cloacibacterium normanense]